MGTLTLKDGTVIRIINEDLINDITDLIVDGAGELTLAEVVEKLTPDNVSKISIQMNDETVAEYNNLVLDSCTVYVYEETTALHIHFRFKDELELLKEELARQAALIDQRDDKISAQDEAIAAQDTKIGNIENTQVTQGKDIEDLKTAVQENGEMATVGKILMGEA